MGMRIKRAKLFRLNPLIASRFEMACRLLGLEQSKIIEKLICDWLDSIQDQLTLDQFMAKSKPSVTINLTHNDIRLNLIMARIAKIHPNEWIRQLDMLDVSKMDQGDRMTWTEQIAEILKEATEALQIAEMQGLEEYASILRELITKARAKLKELLHQSYRS